MIKNFDSFVSEGNDFLSKKGIERGEYGIHHKKQTKNLNVSKLTPEELSEAIESVEPGDTLLLRCQWAVSLYAVPRVCKAVFRNDFEKINCSTLTKADISSSLFKPNKIYLLNEIHRTADDVLKPLLAAILNSDKSGFIITTSNYDNEDSEFWDMLATPSMKDRFTKVYEVN